MDKLILITQDGKQYELSPEIVRDLEDLARRNNLTIESALAQALANEQFLESLEARGAKLLYDEGGEVRQIVRRPLVTAA